MRDRREQSVGVRYETRLMLVLGLAYGIVFFDRNALNFLMPFVREEIPLSNTQIGALAAGLSLAWAASGYAVGNLADKGVSRKTILIVSVLLFSASSFVTGLANSFVTLVAARLMMGLFEGPVLPISQSILALESSPSRRGFNMGVLQNVSSNLIGALAAPIILVSLAAAVGWRNTFFLTVLPGLVTTFLIWWFVLKQQVEPELKRSTATAGGAHRLEILRTRNIVLCIVISTAIVGWILTAWIFLPLYLTAVGMAPTQMGMVLSTIGIASVIAGFLVPLAADRFGRRPTLVLFCAIGALAPLAVYLLADRAVWLAAALCVTFAASGTFSLVFGTIPSESVPVARISTALGIVMGGGELLGGVGAPLLVGWATDQLGQATPLVFQGGFAIIAAIASLFLRETRPEPEHDRPLLQASA